MIEEFTKGYSVNGFGYNSGWKFYYFDIPSDELTRWIKEHQELWERVSFSHSLRSKRQIIWVHDEPNLSDYSVKSRNEFLARHQLMEEIGLHRDDVWNVMHQCPVLTCGSSQDMDMERRAISFNIFENIETANEVLEFGENNFPDHDVTLIKRKGGHRSILIKNK